MTTSPSNTETPAEAPETDATKTKSGTSQQRISALDVLRGFALCGILFVNIKPVTHFAYDNYSLATLGDASGWLQLFVQQRFFPIFSLLFGMGFSLFLRSAANRAPRPRLLLVRRLLVLLLLGGAHQVLHPGEALLFYAVFGLVLLLPSSWLPRWAVAALAVLLTPFGVYFGGTVLIPGMFMVGSALVRYGVVDTFDRAWRVPLVAFFAFAGVALPALIVQIGDIGNSGFSTSSAIAGLAMAGAYVCLILVLLQTPVRAGLQRIFAPLGRMALTNYIGATLIMVGLRYAFDLPASESWGLLMGLAAGILALQWVFSTLWLRRFTQGPLEWVWRTATWWQAQPLRRPSSVA